MTPLVSICICTFRRPEGLGRVLASIAALDCPADCRIEVVVVDNDASGSAESLVNERAREYPHQLRYFCEPTSGVGHARNRCLREAEGEWIAFIDDDEWADTQWLSALWRCLHSGPHDGVFGPVLASFESPPPAYLIGSGLYDRPRFETGTRLRWSDCASGSVVFRRALRERVGSFSPAFATSGGEDSDFFWRCLDAGAVFVWCDTAIAWENIPPLRMSRSWLRRRAYLGGRNYARLVAHHGSAASYVALAVHGVAAMLIFGLKALGAHALRSPRALAYETKVAGGWGKAMAALVPASTEYGSAADHATRQQ